MQPPQLQEEVQKTHSDHSEEEHLQIKTLIMNKTKANRHLHLEVVVLAFKTTMILNHYQKLHFLLLINLQWLQRENHQLQKVPRLYLIKILKYNQTTSHLNKNKTQPKLKKFKKIRKYYYLRFRQLTLNQKLVVKRDLKRNQQ